MKNAGCGAGDISRNAVTGSGRGASPHQTLLSLRSLCCLRLANLLPGLYTCWPFAYQTPPHLHTPLRNDYSRGILDQKGDISEQYMTCARLFRRRSRRCQRNLLCTCVFPRNYAKDVKKPRCLPKRRLKDVHFH